MNLSNPDLEGLKDRMIALGRGPIPDAKAIRGAGIASNPSASVSILSNKLLKIKVRRPIGPELF